MTREQYEASLAAVQREWVQGLIDKREAYRRSLELFNAFWRIYTSDRGDDRDQEIRA